MRADRQHVVLIHHLLIVGSEEKLRLELQHCVLIATGEERLVVGSAIITRSAVVRKLAIYAGRRRSGMMPS